MPWFDAKLFYQKSFGITSHVFPAVVHPTGRWLSTLRLWVLALYCTNLCP